MGRGLNREHWFFVPDTPTETDRAAVLEPLAAFNRQQVTPGPAGPLAVLLQDRAGATVGGLWGTVLFDWLQIELLFVPEPMRGQGIGSALITRAEATAAERSCRGAWLDTFAFQARGFYEKLGYAVFGEIEGHPAGSVRYFLRKVF